MGAMTIAQAEAALARMGGLSDDDRRRGEAEIQAARAQAAIQGTRAAEGLAQQVREDRDDLLRDLCEVRDGLAAAGANRDARALTDLRQRRERLLRQVEEVERVAAQVETIEADPAAYGDSLYAKYPLTRPRFSF